MANERGPFEWGSIDTADLDGYHTIRSLLPVSAENIDFERVLMAFRNLLRYSNYFPCLHAGRVNGFQISVNSDGNIVLTHGDGNTYTLGDVVGPASATDNALARYDEATGKLIQDSIVILTDAGDLTGAISLALTARSSMTPIQSTEGAFWVEDTEPTTPKFTDSDGTDFDLATGAGSGGSDGYAYYMGSRG